MNLRRFSLKTAAAGLALAVGIPAMAMAANPFEDVLDGQWYTEPVDWAYNEGITTGKTPTTFNGWDDTNRYEVVTFVHRYHENIVAPGLDDLDDAIDEAVDMQFAMFGHDAGPNTISATGTTPAFTGMNTSVTIPEGYDGVIVIDFSAESSCYGGTALGNWCGIEMRVDGDDIVPAGFAFDSDDQGTESANSWEAHATRFVTERLDPGTYDIEIWGHASVGGMTFRLDEMTLTAEVQLVGDHQPSIVLAEEG
ncbi:MAG: hypothetical protein AAF081_04220 [Actinomycetota bacterium]